jgi:hypothetical protein
MPSNPYGWWAVLWLALGCGLPPSEVVDVYDGSGSSSAGVGPTGGSSGDAASSTGPVAEATGGSTAVDGGSTTSGGGDSTTAGLEPATGTTGDLPGSSSSGGEPPDPTTGGEQDCNDIYGTAPGYELCEENEDECRFDANLDGGSCHDMCIMFGGMCIGALGNGQAGGCGVTGMDDCADTPNTEICICTK